VSGSQLKWLSVVDEYTRECLALKVDRGITSEDVIDTLSEHLDWYQVGGGVTSPDSLSGSGAVYGGQVSL